MFASRVKLERRLVQLMILVAARLATAHYAWFIHEPHALNSGISPDIVEAIRERRTPYFTREDERVVYDITMELNTTRSLSEANYQRGMEILGEQAMVELVSAIGLGRHRILPGPEPGQLRNKLNFYEDRCNRRCRETGTIHH